MHTRGLLALTFLTAAVVHVTSIAAADNPTAGLLAGHNGLTPVMSVQAGTTNLGSLNPAGERVFNLQNASGKPITTLAVTIDAGAAVKPLGYGCSAFNALLKTCTVEVEGNVIRLLFSGAPEIKTDAQFRLGFAPGAIAGPWPAAGAVSVVVNGQPSSR